MISNCKIFHIKTNTKNHKLMKFEIGSSFGHPNSIQSFKNRVFSSFFFLSLWKPKSYRFYWHWNSNRMSSPFSRNHSKLNRIKVWRRDVGRSKENLKPRTLIITVIKHVPSPYLLTVNNANISPQRPVRSRNVCPHNQYANTHTQIRTCRLVFHNTYRHAENRQTGKQTSTLDTPHTIK